MPSFRDRGLRGAHRRRLLTTGRTLLSRRAARKPAARYQENPARPDSDFSEVFDFGLWFCPINGPTFSASVHRLVRDGVGHASLRAPELRRDGIGDPDQGSGGFRYCRPRGAATHPSEISREGSRTPLSDHAGPRDRSGEPGPKTSRHRQGRVRLRGSHAVRYGRPRRSRRCWRCWLPGPCGSGDRRPRCRYRTTSSSPTLPIRRRVRSSQPASGRRETRPGRRRDT